VLRRDPFVPEVAVDLVDAFEPADDQALQVQLRGDAKKELHIQRVVMGHERPRQRPPGDRLHHRGLDLQIAARIEEAADRDQHLAAHFEDAARVRVDDQVEVALAVSNLDVTQPVPLFRQRQEALGEELERRGMNRELVRLRAEQLPLDADEVAQVQQLEQREVAPRQRVLPDVGLNPGTAVRQHEEIGFAEAADREDPSRRACLDRSRLERFPVLPAMRRDQLADGVAALEPPRIRLDAQRGELLEVRAPLPQQIRFPRFLGDAVVHGSLFTHGAALSARHRGRR
jgi:hypothetical protein